MGSDLLLIFAIMFAVAGVSIWFGYKLGDTPIPLNELEQIKEKAFEEAKKEYLVYFHNRFDPQGEAVSNTFMQRLQNENNELSKQNKKLAEELEKERKKNESISSVRREPNSM